MPVENVTPASPNTLPPRPRRFVDRDHETSLVAGAVSDTQDGELNARAWVAGVQGVGKTTLAVQLAYGYQERYPDGQFYVECAGSTPGGPLSPGEIAARLLRQFGHPEEDIPPAAADRFPLWRRLTHHRRILVVLDDVASCGQIEDVLPSAPQALVLVTSRALPTRVQELDFTEVTLRTFGEKVARQLLTAVVGPETLQTDPVATTTLLSVCGGLPLALIVAAINIARRHDRPLAGFVSALRDDPLRRLNADGDRPVQNAFDACYRLLPDRLSAAYRVLSLHPGPEFGIAAAAAMLGSTEDEAYEAADGLVDHQLLLRTAPDRYSFHHLIWWHARSCAIEELTDERRGQLVAAAVRWYLWRAIGCIKTLAPRPFVGPDFDRIEAAFRGPDARQRAHAVLTVEEANLRLAVATAAQFGMAAECAQLAQAMHPWAYDTDRDETLVELAEAGPPAAAVTDDAELVLRAWRDLGFAYEKVRELDKALRAFVECERLADQHGWHRERASALEGQGLVSEQAGDRPAALSRLREARRIVAEKVTHAEHRARALALLDLHIGRILVAAGRPGEAVDGLAAAHRFFTERGTRDRVNLGRAAQTLGRASLAAGRPAAARDWFRAALDAFAETDSLPAQQLAVHEDLVRVARELSDAAGAREHRARAAALARRLGLLRRADELAADGDDPDGDQPTDGAH